MSTIAKNHLSNLSNYGRFGDTEIRKIDGKLAHVNIKEAGLIDEYGELGEIMTKEHGSGSINPITGMREHFDPFTAFAVGVSIYNTFSKKQQDRQNAGLQVDLLTEGIAFGKDALEKNQEAFVTGQEIISEDFTQQSEYNATSFRTQKGTNKSSYDTAVSGGDFALSGEINKSLELSSDALGLEFDKSMGDLSAGYGSALGDLVSGFEGEKGRLLSEDRKMRAERRYYDSIA